MCHSQQGCAQQSYQGAKSQLKLVTPQCFRHCYGNAASVTPTKVKDVILVSLSKQSPFVNSGYFLCQGIAEPGASISRKLTWTIAPNISI